MVNGIYVAASGMGPRITQIDNVSNNLANVSTNGFKKSSVFLRELITAQNALDHAKGIERTETTEELWVDHSQGTFDKTGNDFDLAINGSGFFRVRDGNGNMYYTRDGRFHRDAIGALTSNDGMYLLDNLQNILIIDGDDVAIADNGDVIVDGETAGTIGLAEFDQGDYNALQGVGINLFEKPAAVNETISNPATEIYQGFLEDANVEPVRAMVDMIEIFRAFELGQKALQMQDQTLQKVVTEVGLVR